YKGKSKWFLFVENVAGIFVMLSSFMLNVFRIGRDRSLRFSPQGLIIPTSVHEKYLTIPECPKAVWRILKHHKYHPYHVSLHQDLHGTDFQNHLKFCQWAREQIQMNPNFFRSVLIPDESTFTNHGHIDITFKSYTGRVRLSISVLGLSTCGAE
ncbi:hypothetical protein BDFB_009340, partial [Asbolus verrucosus]